MSNENVELQSPIVQAVGRLSDRALARLVGANAYLRGRVYARQDYVHDLAASKDHSSARVHGRATEPYDVSLDITLDGGFQSHCSCPAWRGQERHCKHVAAVLVALRDMVRPPKAPGEPGAEPALPPEPKPQPQHAPQAPRPPKQKGHHGRMQRDNGGPREVVVMDRLGPRVVSTTGSSATVQSVSASGSPQDRANWATWLPPSEPSRAPDFEYRLQVRSASLTVTMHHTDNRHPISPSDAEGALGAHPSAHRPILRVLNRVATRGSRNPTVELRGEDAAELISLLRGRRVLLEPALMELRYLDEPLVARLDLELVPPGAIRVRVVFERKGGDGRRFNLTQGLWLEGTPGWHIDPIQGIARPLADSVTPPWIERFSRAPSILHPTQDIGRLLTDVVPRVAGALSAPLPDIHSVVDLVDAVPTFVLRARGDLVNVYATLHASYGEVELDVPSQDLPSPLAIVPSDSPRPRCIRRDIGSELMAVNRLIELGLAPAEDHKSFLATGDRATSFWSQGIGTLPEDWDRYIPDDLVDVTVRSSPVTPRARVSSGVDWLTLDVEFSSEGAKVSEEEVLKALAEGRQLVRLEDGTYAPIATDRVNEVLTRMAEIFAQGRRRVPLAQAGRVQDLLRSLEGGAQVSVGARDFFARMSEDRTIDPIALPRRLKATLRPYQEQGFSWLVWLQKTGTGGILADDMGLGKTLEAITLLQWVKEQRALKTGVVDVGLELEFEDDSEPKTKRAPKKGARAAAKTVTAEEPAPEPVAPKRGRKKAAEAAAPEAPPEDQGPPPVAAPTFALPDFKGPLALVICPTSVVPNWVREIERFAPGLRAMAWSGTDRERYKDDLVKNDVIVTSYAILRRDEELLAELDCAYVILDEAQHIKNPVSATARAAKRLRGKRRLALTGTPIENRLSEIWSIFDFVSPGLLGALHEFEERYARPIDRGDDDAAKRLRNTIHPFVLRRTKIEVARDLPDKIVSELLCDLTPSQAQVYRSVLRSVRESVLGDVERLGINKSQLQILAGLTRLRQAACDARLLKVPGEFTHDDSGKLQALRELLSEAIPSGHRTLVFSQFVMMLDQIRAMLDEDGITYEYIDGSTKDRQERVDRFNRDENIPVFLVSLKAGGTGLNLTGADTVVHFDPWWNPAVEDQATDRAHRIGQTKVVTAYRLVARGTIEEKILSLSEKKRELVANVLGREEEDNVVRGLSKQDVESLLADE